MWKFGRRKREVITVRMDSWEELLEDLDSAAQTTIMSYWNKYPESKNTFAHVAARIRALRAAEQNA